MRHKLSLIRLLSFFTVISMAFVGCGVKNEPEQELISAAFAAAESYEQLVNDDLDTGAILRCLEEASYTASDVLSEYGFVNEHAIRDFFENDRKYLDFVRVYHDGALMYTRIYDDEAGRRCANVRLKRSGDKMELSYYECFPLVKLELTERGWLIYTCDIPDNTASSDHDGYIEPTTMLRLKKQDEQCRLFEEKYLSSIGYNYHDLFTSDWSADNMDGVTLNDLYLSLYKLANGAYISYFNNPYPLLEGTPFSMVPEDEFEKLIQEYIYIDSEQIKESSHYDADRGAYPVCIDGPHDGLAKIPVPEVVDVKENPDGTYTMLVEAVFVEFATDCAFSHELTVRPYEDGSFKYISNRVLPESVGVLPERQTYFKN